MIPEYKYIEPFKISDEVGTFIGTYIFSNKDYSFLLNAENGCSIVLDSALANEIQNHNISEALAMRLIQRGLIFNKNSMPPVVEESEQPTFLFSILHRHAISGVYIASVILKTR